LHSRGSFGDGAAFDCFCAKGRVGTGTPEGKLWRAESPLVRPQAHTPAPGDDAPTTAREQGLQLYGAFTLFFRWRKKSVQKKAGGTATPEAARPAARYSQISAFRALPCPALVFAQACQSLTAYGSCAHWARAPSRPKLRSAGALRGCPRPWFASLTLPGKSPLLPIFERGSSQCRAQHCWRDNTYVRARSCSLLSSFKKGKAFSLRCLSPLCFPAGGVWQTQMAMLGIFPCYVGGFAASINRPVFQFTVGGEHTQPAPLGMLR